MNYVELLDYSYSIKTKKLVIHILNKSNNINNIDIKNNSNNNICNNINNFNTNKNNCLKCSNILEDLDYLEVKNKNILNLDISLTNNLINLTYLDLSNNKLFDINNISYLCNLRTLKIDYNNIDNIPFNLSKNLNKIEYFSISNNNIKNIDEFVANVSIQNNNCIKYLILNDNKIENIPFNICFLSNLICLFLHNNELIKIPTSICELNNLKEFSLEWFHVYDCNLENIQFKYTNKDTINQQINKNLNNKVFDNFFKILKEKYLLLFINAINLNNFKNNNKKDDFTNIMYVSFEDFVKSFSMIRNNLSNSNNMKLNDNSNVILSNYLNIDKHNLLKDIDNCNNNIVSKTNNKTKTNILNSKYFNNEDIYANKRNKINNIKNIVQSQTSIKDLNSNINTNNLICNSKTSNIEFIDNDITTTPNKVINNYVRSKSQLFQLREIKHSSNINNKDNMFCIHESNFNYNSIFKLIENNYLHLIKIYIKLIPNIITKLKNEEGRNVLYYAIHLNKVNIVNYILNFILQNKKIIKTIKTPYIYLHKAIRCRNYEIVYKLVNVFNYTDKDVDDQGSNAYHILFSCFSVVNNNNNNNNSDFFNNSLILVLIANALIKYTSISLNRLNSEKWAPIHIAARKGNIDCLEWIISNNKYNKDKPSSKNKNKCFDINMKGKNNWTPLHLSVNVYKYNESVLLLKNNADIFAKNKDNKKPIDVSNNNFLFYKLLKKYSILLILSKMNMFKKKRESNQNLIESNKFNRKLSNETQIIYSNINTEKSVAKESNKQLIKIDTVPIKNKKKYKLINNYFDLYYKLNNIHKSYHSKKLESVKKKMLAEIKDIIKRIDCSILNIKIIMFELINIMNLFMFDKDIINNVKLEISNHYKIDINSIYVTENN